MNRLDEVVELTRTQLLQFLREPEAMFWTFAFPVIVSAALGFAFRRGEIPPNRIAVLEGPGRTELVARLEADPHVEVVGESDRALALRGLQSGRLDAIVTPVGVDAAPGVTLDPDRAEAETARLRIALALHEGEPADVALDHPTGNGSRYIDFLYPGLLGLNLMATGMWSMGFSIARMRQQNVLRRMLVTPMRKSSFLLSLLFARLFFLVVELVILIAFGKLVLDIPFRAGWLTFLALCVVGAGSFSGLGLLATARSKTIEGASGMLNLVMMPMWLLSGVFFSYERFPEWMHEPIRLLPLTALIDALRLTMLEGAGALELTMELAVLAVVGVVSFAAAVRIFRWE